MSERVESSFEKSTSSSSSSSSPESSQEITMMEIEMESTVEDSNAHKTKGENAKRPETPNEESIQINAENNHKHKLQPTLPLLSSTLQSTLRARQRDNNNNNDNNNNSIRSETLSNKKFKTNQNDKNWKELEVMPADEEKRHNEQHASSSEEQQEEQEQEQQKRSTLKETERFEHPSSTSVNVANEPKSSYNVNKKIIKNEHDIRQTQEYLAAWDLELWKAVQADRFRGQMQKYKEKALNELNHLIDLQKEKAQQETEQRMREVVEREAKVSDVRKQLDERERRLQSSEQEVQRMKRSLMEAEHRAEEEIRLQVRRANDELRHKLSLMQERVKAADLQAQRADERQRQAQREYIELYEEFARFRTRQVTGSLHTATAGNSANTLPHSGTESVHMTTLDLPLMNTRINYGEQTEYATNIIASCELRLAKLKVEHSESLRALEEKHANKLTNMNDQLRQVEEKNKQLTAAIARRREQLQLAKKELQMYKNDFVLLLRSKEKNTRGELKGRNKTGSLSTKRDDKSTDVEFVKLDQPINDIGACGRGSKFYVDTLDVMADNDSDSCDAEYDQKNRNVNRRTKMKKAANVKLSNHKLSYKNLTGKKETFFNNKPFSETFTQRQLLQDEINRLQRERKTLIWESKGAINDDDEVIRRVDEQIKLLSKELIQICEYGPVVETQREEEQKSLIIDNNNVTNIIITS